jgi:Lon-like ATP-dependent protease
MVGSTGGLVMSIEAEIAPAMSAKDAKLIATGKLGEIAREAVQNVSAILKKYRGTDISNYDIHIQFLQSYEGVEGDSASVSVATAVISALERIPIDQSIATTGSLSVKGEVLPVGGLTEKVEAAIEAGLKTVVIPYSNKGDIVLDKKMLSKIKIVTAKTLTDVLQSAFKKSKEKEELIRKISKIINS